VVQEAKEMSILRSRRKFRNWCFLGPWMHSQSSLSGDMRYETSRTWSLIIKCIYPPGMSSERELAHPICSNKIEHVLMKTKWTQSRSFSHLNSEVHESVRPASCFGVHLVVDFAIFNNFAIYTLLVIAWPCHDSSGYSLFSHAGGSGWRPGQFML
jgi:hypothetical protein